MTKGQRQDFFREIRKSWTRFVSILFIVLLGVAFFAGLRSAEGDMKRTADAYLDGQQFMDIRILSTLGLTEDDRQAIEAVRGVKRAEGIYSVDVLTDLEDTQKVLTIISVPEDIARLHVTDGRLPLKAGECILDDEFAASAGYHVGDTIRIYMEEGEVSDKLCTDEYEIVGLGKNPWYLTFDRGSATIGNGSLSGFMAIQKVDFVQDIYTQIYVVVEDAAEYSCYEDAYLDLIDEMQER